MPKTSETEGKAATITKPDDYFKAIVEKCKPNLPRNWRERVLQRFPDLNTLKGASLLNNIYNLRSAANVEVILYMADLADANRRGTLSETTNP